MKICTSKVNKHNLMGLVYFPGLYSDEMGNNEGCFTLFDLESPLSLSTPSPDTRQTRRELDTKH